MKYFWLEESDIPEGVGFRLFGWEHIAVMMIILTVVILVAGLYRKRMVLRRRILIFIAIMLPLTEAARLLLLIAIRRFGIGHLPLHLCSVSIAAYPLYVLMKSGRIKAFLGDFNALVLLPAGLGAILFPDWTMYPVISFMSLSSFFWHLLQILLPLCIALAGEICPVVKIIPGCTAALVLLTVPVYLFDIHFHCNYFFLLRPVPGPLEIVYDRLGPAGYLPDLAVMIVFIMLITCLAIRAVQSIERSGHGTAQEL